MDAIMVVVVGAVLVEAITSAVKPIWDASKRKISWGVAASLGVGLGIAFAANLDLAAAVGLPIGAPAVPQIISGVVISRGANFVYDLWGKVRGEAQPPSGDVAG
jgi:hypothetical protein